MKKTKGIKIDGEYIVAMTGSALVGCMSWETPYVYFHNGDSANVMVWHSDSSAEAADHLSVGQTVQLNAFLYGDHLRRVKVKTENDIVFGMR